MTVKGLLPAELASWKTAVPIRELTVGFGGLYVAWGSPDWCDKLIVYLYWNLLMFYASAR
jgi:hypothetical protein